MLEFHWSTSPCSDFIGSNPDKRNLETVFYPLFSTDLDQHNISTSESILHLSHTTLNLLFLIHLLLRVLTCHCCETINLEHTSSYLL
jgi:hypothetical protein